MKSTTLLSLDREDNTINELPIALDTIDTKAIDVIANIARHRVGGAV
jgi:hypothetical protein